MKKRSLIYLLVCCLMVSLMPFSAFALEAPEVAPKLTSAYLNKTTRAVTLSIQTVSSADGYRLYYSVNDGRDKKYADIKDIETNTYTAYIDDNDAGNIYYKIAAYNQKKIKKYYNTKTKKWQSSKPKKKNWKGKKTKKVTKREYTEKSDPVMVNIKLGAFDPTRVGVTPELYEKYANIEANKLETDVVRALMFYEINECRTNAGLKPVKQLNQFTNAAQNKANDFYNRQYCTHAILGTNIVTKFIENTGIAFDYSGENIAQNYKTVDKVMNAWMNTNANKYNIMNRDIQYVGIGYNQHYWCVDFSKGVYSKQRFHYNYGYGYEYGNGIIAGYGYEDGYRPYIFAEDLGLVGI